jgi:hypothetical protein
VKDGGVTLDPALRAVDLAERSGVKAQLAAVAQDRRQPLRRGAEEAIIEVVVTVLPREEGDPARSAYWARADDICATHPLGGESIQLGSADLWVAGVSEIAGVELVSQDEDHVAGA